MILAGSGNKSWTAGSDHLLPTVGLLRGNSAVVVTSAAVAASSTKFYKLYITSILLYITIKSTFIACSFVLVCLSVKFSSWRP